MITINNKYNSSNLLFSIPVHEKQDIVNNTVENIFHFNPNSKIILHINKTFKDFDPSLSTYHNLFINKTNIDYIKGGDLLAYHISNFSYCIKNNISFEYFILSASNELYIKRGSNIYIDTYKNGLQIVKQNEDFTIDWHNFKKNIENNESILKLFKFIQNNQLCGGQAEGQFYQKHVFQKIYDLYIQITSDSEPLNFEAEEIIPQTIFHSLNLEYNDPITLQNYTNNIDFTIPYIQELTKHNIQIQSNTLKNQLVSPHLQKYSENIYSIKRVDRNFNKIRKYLTNKGFILNDSNHQSKCFMFDTYYYSHNSSLLINQDYQISFQKNTHSIKDFQWFGYFLKKGSYLLEFEFKINKFINEFSNCGIKIHYPYQYIISNIFQNCPINEFKKISIPIHLLNDQNVIFIFDDFHHSLQFFVKNFELKEINDSNYSLINNNESKKNIIFVLFQNNGLLNENYDNIKNYVIDVFNKIYNVLIIVILNNKINKNNEKYIMKHLNPHSIYYDKNIDFNIIIQYTTDFINKYNIKYEFIFINHLDLYYLKKINELKLIINKINFLCFNNQLNHYDVDYSLCLIPNSYFDLFIHQNLIHIKKFLNRKSIDYHLLIDNFYFQNNKIVSFDSIQNHIKNNGFLFETNFEKQIVYTNNTCFFKKLNSHHYYFYKKYSNIYKQFCWFGYTYKFNKEQSYTIQLKLTFELKINHQFNTNFNHQIGIKTHYPTQYYNNFLNTIILNEFNLIEVFINIEKKNQLIIFNFDNYLDELELEIKNLKITFI
jgi:hypothetical protein